jgi:hypothetical protein
MTYLRPVRHVVLMSRKIWGSRCIISSKEKMEKKKKFAVGRGRVHVHVSSFASICQGTFISAASLYKDLAVV